MSAQILKALDLGPVNSGTYLGNGEWSKTTDAGLLQSINPSTNEVIAEVHASSESDCCGGAGSVGFAGAVVFDAAQPPPLHDEASRSCSRNGRLVSCGPEA